jgi:hypothetical protein
MGYPELRLLLFMADVQMPYSNKIDVVLLGFSQAPFLSKSSLY